VRTTDGPIVVAPPQPRIRTAAEPPSVGNPRRGGRVGASRPPPVSLRCLRCLTL